MAEDFILREVENSDAETVTEIFNFFVENSFAAYPEEKMKSDFYERLKKMASGYPFYIIERKNKVIGFGLLRPFYHTDTFRRSAEITYFILPEYTNKGLGKQFLDILEKEGKERGIDTILANISSKNEQSLNFHLKYGFKECGRFIKVGKKFNEDFDVVYMQKFI